MPISPLIAHTEFLGTFQHFQDLPRLPLPEFAFGGRSNVGKSSLINMLTGRSLARTSKTPGCTRGIHLYRITTRHHQQWLLADLPGYGYARVPKTLRKHWQQLIWQYLLQRPTLMMFFLLVDSRIEPTSQDKRTILQLGKHQIPFALVLTKCDALNQHELHRQHQTWKTFLAQHWEEPPKIFLTSSRTQLGKHQLLTYIQECLQFFTHPKPWQTANPTS